MTPIRISPTAWRKTGHEIVFDLPSRGNRSGGLGAIPGTGRPAIAKFGGRYLIRGASPEVIEGDDWAPPNAGRQQIIVVEFPSDLEIHAWYTSPEYAEALTHRQQAVRRRLLFVDGVEEQKA